jgi:glycosyltransferase involved in cell wall biosynthesis
VTFSLILATVDRTREVGRFLDSLAAQAYRSVEVLVVDQNPDDRLGPVLRRLRGAVVLRHLRAPRGLSRARNVGLRHAEGEVLAFPDDDCWYPPDLLERVAGILHAHPDWDGVTGRAVDPQGRPTSSRWDRRGGRLTRMNVWGRAISFTLFFRRRVVLRVGEFDESLGAGAPGPWGSGEETDYLLRALREGLAIYYLPDLAVYHATPVRDPQTARAYGMGMGRVMRIHGYPLWFVAYQWARPLLGVAGAALSGDVGRARYHLAVAQGRMRGWWSGGRQASPAR